MGKDINKLKEYVIVTIIINLLFWFIMVYGIILSLHTMKYIAFVFWFVLFVIDIDTFLKKIKRINSIWIDK